MADSKTILGIDIGSTKITAAVGELEPARGLIWRGLNVRPTEAIDRGIIRDLNQATADLDAAYSGAMYTSGLAVDRVYVGITGSRLRSVTSRAMLDVPNLEGEVKYEDIANVSEQAQRVILEPGEQIVHYHIREFNLDGLHTSSWPVGMIGHKLEAEAHVVVGNSSQMMNIAKAVQKLGLKVQSYVYSLLAAAEAVLSEEDRTGGCVLIDFGGRTTNVGVFHGGALSFSRCIAIGGSNYDHDLKQGLGVDLMEAQRIKKSYGKAWMDVDMEELDDLVAVKYYGRREFDRIKRRRIYEIMQPRTEELLEQIIDALNDSGLMPRITGGIIITGGGSLLRQLKMFLQKSLHRQVRLGVPTGIAHLLDEYRTPVYAGPLGLLLYGAKYDRGPAPQEAGDSFLGEMVEALGDIFSGLIRKR
jgi:cell division protein FtsA